MKSHKFFFSVVALVIVFLVFFFAVIKPQFFAALKHEQNVGGQLSAIVKQPSVGQLVGVERPAVRGGAVKDIVVVNAVNGVSVIKKVTVV